MSAEGGGHQPPGGGESGLPPSGEDGNEVRATFDIPDPPTATATGAQAEDPAIQLGEMLRRAAIFATRDLGHDVRPGTSSIEFRQKDRVDLPEWNDAFVKAGGVNVAMRIWTSAFLLRGLRLRVLTML